MRHALDGFVIGGIDHNMSFLAALMNHPRFVEGRLTTNFIAEEFPDGFTGLDLDDRTRRRLVLVAADLHRRREERNRHIAGRRPRLRDLADRVVRLDGENHPVTVTPMAGGHEISVGKDSHSVLGNWQIGDPRYDCLVDGDRMVVQVAAAGGGFRLTHGGASVDVLVLTPTTAELARLMPVKAPPDLSKYLMSPMPGLLVSLSVEEGQTVGAGDPLAVVEAMKMENILRAERDGRISALHAAVGDSLAVDQRILEFE